MACSGAQQLGTQAGGPCALLGRICSTSLFPGRNPCPCIGVSCLHISQLLLCPYADGCCTVFCTTVWGGKHSGCCLVPHSSCVSVWTAGQADVSYGFMLCCLGLCMLADNSGDSCGLLLTCVFEWFFKPCCQQGLKTVIPKGHISHVEASGPLQVCCSMAVIGDCHGCCTATGWVQGGW